MQNRALPSKPWTHLGNYLLPKAVLYIIKYLTASLAPTYKIPVSTSPVWWPTSPGGQNNLWSRTTILEVSKYKPTVRGRWQNPDDTVTVVQCPDEETDKSHSPGTADSLLWDYAQLWILKELWKTGIPSIKGYQIDDRLGENAIRKIFECRWLACTKEHDRTFKNVQAAPWKKLLGIQNWRLGTALHDDRL